MQGSELSARIVQPLLSYLDETGGPAACERLAAAAGIPLTSLRNSSTWIDVGSMEALLAAARAQVQDDAEFQRACVHRLQESFGPVTYLLRARTVRSGVRQMVESFRIVSRCSHYEFREGSRTHAVIQYVSKRRENRLTCLARQAQLTAFCGVCGGLESQVSESACIDRGDPYCEYRLTWRDPTRWLPVAVGAAVGALFGLLLAHYSPHGLLMVLLPLLGGLIGRIWEFQRANRSALDANEGANEALREFAEQTKEARDEVLALKERREGWSAALEEQIGERTRTLRAVTEKIGRLRAERAENLAGLSEDLRNPLATLRTQHRLLEARSRRWNMPEQQRPIVADLGLALDQMDRLLHSVLTSSAAELPSPAPAEERILVSPLAERLQRRLEALVFGRDICVDVRVTREAPSAIRMQSQLFDRVVDNLLSNAAKYTVRGSIVVELDGVPGMLCIRVADTGPGIPQERTEAVFLARSSQDEVRDVALIESHGVGLSGVVRLLGGVGGRLELLSRVGVGTTFWAYLPIEPKPPVASTEDHAALVRQIVTVRQP